MYTVHCTYSELHFVLGGSDVYAGGVHVHIGENGMDAWGDLFKLVKVHVYEILSFVINVYFLALIGLFMKEIFAVLKMHPNISSSSRLKVSKSF